jgi:hypothetical protein
VNADKFQLTTFSLSKRFALGRNYIYVEFSNLNLEMMLVERIFVTVKGLTVKVYFCCFIRF